MTGIKRYGQVQSTTATKEQLLQQLFEAALARIRAGRAALERGQPDEASPALIRASQIVNLLLATLDRRHAPELCKQLTDVYTFVCARLIAASVKRDAQAAAEAERVFTPVASGFLQVLSLPPSART